MANIDIKKIYFIGLPGSGKTTVSNLLEKEINFLSKYCAIKESIIFTKNPFFFLLFRLNSKVIKKIGLYELYAKYTSKKNPNKKNDHLSLKYNNFLLKDEEYSKNLAKVANSFERDLVFITNQLKDMSYIDDDGIPQRLLSAFGLRMKSMGKKEVSFVQEVFGIFSDNSYFVIFDCELGIIKQRISIRQSGNSKTMPTDNFDNRLRYSQDFLINFHQLAKDNHAKVFKIDSGRNSPGEIVQKIIGFIE